METSNGHIESHLLEHETIRCLYHPESGFIDTANDHKNLLYITSERLLYSQENPETSKTSLISIRDINSIEFHNDQQKRTPKSTKCWFRAQEIMKWEGTTHNPETNLICPKEK